MKCLIILHLLSVPQPVFEACASRAKCSEYAAAFRSIGFGVWVETYKPKASKK
jgi:hypothetical protein